MIYLALHKLEAAVEAFKKGHYAVAAQDAIDAIEFAIKSLPRSLGVVSREKDHVAPEAFKKKTMQLLKQYLSPDSLDLYAEILFVHQLWCSKGVRNTIRYGVERAEVSEVVMKDPELLVKKELAEIVLHDAQKVVDTINHWYSDIETGKRRLEALEKTFKTNPIDQEQIRKIKEHFSRLELAKKYGYPLNPEEVNEITTDLSDFQKALEEEKQRAPERKDEFEEIINAIIVFLGILALVAILAAIFRKE